ncbi:N-carbamoyl-L-amino acid hydrolase [Hartmannibacter diazotrophicus]|uniref:N-carbamoyl-L-amino acid hydrolase n=1 Tax=Hartmannibacter diazotrophicus TaxID=1482074 RepID=A0A2C9DCV7_9HYPH|nr:Zn-dependent hydrolase [Hartmannibacter diazotrophicus]SON58096.1 N-carbamoyl-L-amino acid hydrolase [Hartmannibacter diazotrophicus]
MPTSRPEIDPERLRALLAGFNAFGRSSETGGYDRIGYSAADMAVRAWFMAEMERDGLGVRMDAVGNVFGRYGPAEGPVLLVGSHLDTVPDGGAFDGALGVAVALECVRAMKAAGFQPRTAIEVVATAEEEGRFGGMLGSQAIAGVVPPGWVEAAADADGVRLVDALRGCGLDPARVPAAARSARDIVAFLELHIEQGPILEMEGRPVGIVTGISGMGSLAVSLEGVANHSGTTPMDMRSDAFAGLAEIAAGFPALIRAHGTDQTRLTIGKVELKPNFIHTIPGLADFTIILRDTDEAVMRLMEEELGELIADVADKHRLKARVEVRSWLSPVSLDAGLNRLLHDCARDLGLDARSMPSGAGHDAQTMQGLCPSALIFVPSRGGISHAPQEWTDEEDCVTGARLMLEALVRLSVETLAG